MGKVMALLKEELAGRADIAKVSAKVKSMLDLIPSRFCNCLSLAAKRRFARECQEETLHSAFSP